MAKRGRKSAADLAIVTNFRQPPPEPPVDLTDEQADEWRAVVGRMPADWFTKETHGTLSEYCRHVTRARFLARALDHFQFDALGEEGGVEAYDRLSKTAERETRALLACARALRLTPQARYDAQAAARKAQSEPAGPRPWE